MKELIKVTVNERQESVVSARDLHQYLELDKSNLSKWLKQIKENVFFEENEDFSVLVLNNEVKNGENSLRNVRLEDLALSINCAKKIAMTSKSSKGNEIRDYFIECEKQLKAPIKPKTQIELIIDIAHVLKEQDLRLTTIEDKINQLEETKQSALLELNDVERSNETVPEIGIRLKVNQLIRIYSEKHSIEHRSVWNVMYNKMLYAYHFNVNAHKKLHDKESKLDIIERCNQLDNLYALVSKELL